jgi:hypothetical protein
MSSVILRAQMIQVVKNRMDQVIFTFCDKHVWIYRDAL